MAYLIDTDILVDYLRQDSRAISYLGSVGDWSYSVVTAMELFAGARDKREVVALEKFRGAFSEIPLTSDTGRKVETL